MSLDRWPKGGERDGSKLWEKAFGTWTFQHEIGFSYLCEKTFILLNSFVFMILLHSFVFMILAIWFKLVSFFFISLKLMLMDTIRNLGRLAWMDWVERMMGNWWGHQYHGRNQIESNVFFLSFYLSLFSCLVPHRLCGEKSRLVGLFKGSIVFNKNRLEFWKKNYFGSFLLKACCPWQGVP